MPNDQGLDLDQIIQQTSAGWKQVGDPVAETQMATDVTGAQKPTPTGRWLVTITDGNHSRQLVLRPQRVEGPTGKVSWSLEEGPKDISGSAAAKPTNVPAATDQRYLVSRNPDGTMSAQENPNYKGDKDEKSTLQPFGDQLLQVKPDGTVTVIASKPKDPEKPTTVTFGDTLYSFDGTNLTALTSKPKDPEKPTTFTDTKTNTLYQWDPKTNSWGVAPGTTPGKPPVAVSTNTQAPNLVSIDEQGNVVGTQANPNYIAPTPTQLTPDLVSPNIPLLKPDGTIDWQPNKNQTTVSQAMSDLLAQVGQKVTTGSISMADAKDLLTGTVNVMNAQTAQQNAAAQRDQTATTAAGDILSNTRGNAQTGAGLLQQRVQAATGTLQSILGNALQNKNITSIPGDTGANLVQGLSGWTAELMGGQATLDSAARMVQAADPSSNMADPTTQAAVATLKQMLDKHAELTGGLHPAVAATVAAQQSQQTNGMAAPQSTGVTSDQDQWLRDWQARQAADAQQQQLAQRIALQNASAPAQAVSQNYGANIAYSPGWTPGMGTTPQPLPQGFQVPMTTQSSPVFIAPPLAPQLASSG